MLGIGAVQSWAKRRARRWGHQLRRKWSVREKPVSESPIADHEWKLIPGADDRLADCIHRGTDEGVYYVLGVDLAAHELVLQRDNLTPWGLDQLELTSRFQPSRFSIT